MPLSWLEKPITMSGNSCLNALMTFFFGLFYFQYPFTRIARWKTTGVLEPQQ